MTTTAHGTLPMKQQPSKKRPHELVDKLSEDQVEAADCYLRLLRWTNDGPRDVEIVDYH